MLLNTMTSAEINKQISSEVLKLKQTTMPRLLQEYDRERRRLKVDKNSTYCKDYRIKTAGKNNWIICVNKPLSQARYTSIDEANICCSVYYYSDKGLLLYCPEEDGRLNVFNAHFLNRYNERLHLGLCNITDVIIHFLKNETPLKFFNSQIISSASSMLLLPIIKLSTNCARGLP